MKITWKHRLVIFFTFFIVTFGLYFLLSKFEFFSVYDSVNKILITSIIQSLLFALVFPVIMKWTSNKLSKKIDAFIPNVLEEGEEIKFEDMANLTKGFEKVGGKLFLTNQRLLFVSHKLNIQSGITTINPNEIISVEKVALSKIFHTGLRITMNDNTSYLFVVNERDTWIDKLQPGKPLAA